MHLYCDSLTKYTTLKTVAVKAGDLIIGDSQPIRVQTMTTPDTMDTKATVEQSIRCIDAGAELIRITAPSKHEAENLLNIKNELRRRGYHTPIVADIHFTPNAAEIAARIVEKVRINPRQVHSAPGRLQNLGYGDADRYKPWFAKRPHHEPLWRYTHGNGGKRHGIPAHRPE